MIANTIPQKLAAGEVVLGCFIPSHDPAIAEIAGLSGFDFVVSDSEHGGVSSRELENVTRAADVVAAVDRVIDAARATETVVGVFAGSSDAAARWIERGGPYVTTGAEGQLGRSLRSFVGPLH